MRLVVIPGDHDPPHVHVVGTGWEMRIRLLDTPSLWDIRGEPKKSEIVKALVATADHLHTLRTMWKDVNHG